MIEVSKLNGEKYYVNAEAIEFIESTPDTMLTLASGKKFVVLESAYDVVEKIIEYKKKLYMDLPRQFARLARENTSEEGEPGTAL